MWGRSDALPNANDLIGRAAALADLAAAVEDVAGGRGRSVWVEGEPGIGKTALLAAGLAQVRDAGCQLFAADADEASPAFPLRVLLGALQISQQTSDPAHKDIVERLWGHTGGPTSSGDPVTAAAEMLLTLIDRLCAAAPVVLVVDDLQWADETSLAIWGRLAEAVDQIPLLLVAAVRPVPRRDEVERLRRILSTLDHLDIQLGPLEPVHVHALVQRLCSAVPAVELEALVGDAGGNPLYVCELVDALRREGRIETRDNVVHLVEPGTVGPSSLAAAIGGRLSFLSEPALRFLRTASILGPEFRLEHLALLTGRPASDLVAEFEEVQTAGVLADRGTGVAFRHGLIHQSLYGSLSVGLRQAMHLDAARAFAEADEPAELVAEHLLAAPVPATPSMMDWLLRAAPGLTSRAPRAAVELLQRCRDAAETTDQRTALGIHLIDAHSCLGNYEEVTRLAPAVLAVTHDPETIGQVTWAQAYAHRILGQLEQALSAVGVALSGTAVSPAWSARLLAVRSMALNFLARFEDALSSAEQAAIEGQRTGDHIAIGWALLARALVLAEFKQDQAAGLASLDRATAVLGDDPSAPDLRLLILANRTAALWNLGRTEEASRGLGQALMLAERAGTPSRLAALRVQAAEIAFYTGRWDDALTELRSAGDLPPHHPTRIMLRGLDALIAVHRDDPAMRSAYVEEGDIPEGSLGMADTLRVARALSAERAGDARQAFTMLLSVVDPEANQQFERLSPDKCLWLFDTIRLARELGEVQTAQAAADACAAEAQRQPLPTTLAAAACVGGLAAGDPIQVLAGAEGFHRIGYRPFEASARENASVLLAARGDLAAARAAFTEGLRIYAELDAAWDIARCDARLRPYGIRRGPRTFHRRAVSGWESLTPTEIKVAHLVAQGKSNPEIATELYLSRSTVQSHVSHVLSKLQCRSRVEIAGNVLTRRPAG